MKNRTSLLKENLGILLVCALMLVAMGLAGSLDVAEEEMELERYCDMVTRDKQGLAGGWPDFRGVYDSQCR